MPRHSACTGSRTRSGVSQLPTGMRTQPRWRARADNRPAARASICGVVIATMSKPSITRPPRPSTCVRVAAPGPAGPARRPARRRRRRPARAGRRRRTTPRARDASASKRQHDRTSSPSAGRGALRAAHALDARRAQRRPARPVLQPVELPHRRRRRTEPVHRPNWRRKGLPTPRPRRDPSRWDTGPAGAGREHTVSGTDRSLTGSAVAPRCATLSAITTGTEARRRSGVWEAPGVGRRSRRTVRRATTIVLPGAQTAPRQQRTQGVHHRQHPGAFSPLAARIRPTAPRRRTPAGPAARWTCRASLPGRSDQPRTRAGRTAARTGRARLYRVDELGGRRPIRSSASRVCHLGDAGLGGRRRAAPAEKNSAHSPNSGATLVSRSQALVT